MYVMPGLILPFSVHWIELVFNKVKSLDVIRKLA